MLEIIGTAALQAGCTAALQIISNAALQAKGHYCRVAGRQVVLQRCRLSLLQH